MQGKNFKLTNIIANTGRWYCYRFFRFDALRSPLYVSRVFACRRLGHFVANRAGRPYQVAKLSELFPLNASL